MSPHVPNGPYCPGVTQTLAFGYLVAKDFIGATCSRALHGRTMWPTGPSSSSSAQSSPVGHCGLFTHSVPSFILITVERIVAETLANVRSCSRAQQSRPRS